MRFTHFLFLLLIALVPFTTLIHRDDRGKWDTQRSAMAAPDEPSYLLMAQHFLDGRGLSLQRDLGRDTFYPPGYPLLLAAWAKLLFHNTLTPFAAHALNATLLCIDTILVYLVASALLVQLGHPRRFLPPFLIAALFATNWHVLETSLLIMSEPAFMLVLFAWLLLAIRWPNCHEKPALLLAMALLATLAWSIRGAGIVCVAAVFLYPLIRVSQTRKITSALGLGLLIALAIPALYQVVLFLFSPEKSLAGTDGGHSYTEQLRSAFNADLPLKILAHVKDYCESFLPMPWHRAGIDAPARLPIAFLLGLLAFAALAVSLKKFSVTHLFALLYIALFLLWPFSYQRFWSPILPLLLVFLWDFLLSFRMPANRTRRPAATVLYALLLLLSVQELWLWLGTHARRLNYVSDALAASAQAIVRDTRTSSAKTVAVFGGDEHILLAWYLFQAARTRPDAGHYLAGGFDIHVPRAQDPNREGKPERYDDFLLRTLDTTGQPYFFSYFPEVNDDTRDTLASLATRGDRVDSLKLYEKRGVAQVWKLVKP